MTYAELAALQYGRAKSFSDAQTAAMAAYCQAEHDLKQLQAENAKLRGLVRDMWPLTVPMPTANCDTKRAAIRQRMHELVVDA